MLESSVFAYYLRCGRSGPITVKPDSQDDLYLAASNEFGRALERLARAYEADADKRRDLLQEIHLQVWRSFAGFDQRCSLRTWVYRVAHHTAASHVVRERRVYSKLVTLEELESAPENRQESTADRNVVLQRLSAMVQRLKPLDRQIIVSYLEGLDAASIGEITGLSAANVAMKIHRIKDLLARRFQEGGQDAE